MWIAPRQALSTSFRTISKVSGHPPSSLAGSPFVIARVLPHEPSSSFSKKDLIPSHTPSKLTPDNLRSFEKPIYEKVYVVAFLIDEGFQPCANSLDRKFFGRANKICRCPSHLVWLRDYLIKYDIFFHSDLLRQKILILLFTMVRSLTIISTPLSSLGPLVSRNLIVFLSLPVIVGSTHRALD